MIYHLLIFLQYILRTLLPYQSDLEKLIIQNDLDIASSGNDYAFCINELIERNSNILSTKMKI